MAKFKIQVELPDLQDFYCLSEQYLIPRGIAEISATSKDLKDA